MFEADRHVLERIEEVVSIWKKEVWSDCYAPTAVKPVPVCLPERPGLPVPTGGYETLESQ